jgi:hypothetical protein
MSLPFTTDQFLGVFRQYNTSIWPAQVLLVALAACAVALAVRAPGRAGRLIALYLASQWAWTGVVYHWWFFSRINPAAPVFAAIWIAGAITFVSGAAGARPLSFRTDRRWRLGIGCALALYALVVYPLIGHFTGRAYPSAPTYGAPCPVTICTFGLLWLADRLPRRLLVAPIVWAAIGSAAAFSLGVYEDVGLLAAGASGVALLVWPGAGSRVAEPIHQLSR